MSAQKTIKATEAELEILNILWTQGPSSVKEVHEKLSLTKDSGYTTTLKQMQVMYAKELLSRDDSRKVHIYTAIVGREQTQGQMLQRMIETMFNGSAMQLVMQALGNHKPSKAELDMITDYREKKKKK